MQTLQPLFSLDLLTRRRRPTREVMVGNVGVGGDNPIRVQSMTTTLTKDIAATVEQSERLVRAGCEIVRITTPTPADARCLGPIKEQLALRGIRVPIVADIHFSPAAALAAAEFADKVRINPGNYTDSRKFASREYTDEQYFAELKRVEERFLPFVLKCKDRGIAMRIGTNHGSLSDRIMNRFGDTPEGMVESALEFVRMCEAVQFHNIILSMKASNPKVMIAAYRLLAARMATLRMDYPFHLGVTEAGNGEDGRIKSAIGIGSLLEDGIGDTIRVSLTEEPEAEIPVAFDIATRYGRGSTRQDDATPQIVPWDLYHYERRESDQVMIGDVPVGGSSTIAVFSTIEGHLAQAHGAMAQILRWASPAGRRQPKPDAAIVQVEDTEDLEQLRYIALRLRKWPQARLALLARSSDAALLIDTLPHVDGIVLQVEPNVDITIPVCAARDAGKVIVLEAAVQNGHHLSEVVDRLARAGSEADDHQVASVLTIRAAAAERIHAYRLLVMKAHGLRVRAPILLQATEVGPDVLLAVSISIGSLLCDGLGDALYVGGDDRTDLAFNVLQAAGARIFKTDYVACPSCGRTLFDLQETTERIKQRTSHLVGVKLAIMGCIVNGPGEMADADFGYVGGAPGQVNLYVGRECVEKGVPAEHADDRLVELIKSRGKWQEEED